MISKQRLDSVVVSASYLLVINRSWVWLPHHALLA